MYLKQLFFYRTCFSQCEVIYDRIESFKNFDFESLNTEQEFAKGIKTLRSFVGVAQKIAPLLNILENFECEAETKTNVLMNVAPLLSFYQKCEDYRLEHSPHVKYKKFHRKIGELKSLQERIMERVIPFVTSSWGSDSEKIISAYEGIRIPSKYIPGASKDEGPSAYCLIGKVGKSQ